MGIAPSSFLARILVIRSERPSQVALQIAFSLFLITCLLTPTAWAAEPLESERVWITVGADAFEMLQHAPEVQLDGQQLHLHEELDQVVLTEVSTKDLEQISALVHEYFSRCSGFLVHPDRAQAEDTLRRATVQRGAPIQYLLDQQPTVKRLQTLLEEANVLETIERLSTDFNNRFYNHPSGRQAAEWIRDLWQGYATGRDDVTVELVGHSWAQPSVVLTIQGAIYPNEIVVLGGHLDSISSGSADPNFLAPGADDNASGIASLSEAIRVLLAADFRPSRTVKFMGYAAEEVGLRGSGDIAMAHRSDNANVVGVLQLDMTAFNGSSEDIALLSDFTNSELTAFVGQLVDTYQPDLVRVATACGYGCSDHASWHNRNYPAAMAFEARFGEHNSSIHQTSDTVQTLSNSAAHALKFSKLSLAFMVEVSTDDLGELFLDGFESGDLSAWNVSP